MSPLYSQLIQVHEKLQMLLGRHDDAVKKIQQLSRENEKLKQQLAQSQEKTATLGEQVDALRIGSLALDADSKKELEKRINLYLKEIDKCMALLKT
jgi:chromosome segregation ATPase